MKKNKNISSFKTTGRKYAYLNIFTVLRMVYFLKKNKIEHVAYFYEGVNHGFHNNTTPRYDEKAATLSWTRTIDFFKDKLKKK